MNGLGDKVQGQSNSNPLSPELVHRVLLTEPSQFSTLTVSGRSCTGDKTPTFEDFWHALKPSSSQSVENVMKRAYRDKISEVVSATRNIQPLQQLVLELHQALRSLVPNRKDLHSTLKDDEVRNTTSPDQLLPFVIQAGESLYRLESEQRSESTQKWCDKARSVEKMDLRSTIHFLVTSMLYLMMKAEMCEQDKQDFFLAHVWAPRIHKQGGDFERQAFQARFGKCEDKSTAPLTRRWVEALVLAQISNRDQLLHSKDARQDLVKKGWIQDILFRGPERPAFLMPEILALDVDQLKSIRLVTKRAAAGSALALHACNAAGMRTSLLEEPPQASSPLELRRVDLQEAMAGTINSEYEENVTNAVVRLAKDWNPSLETNAEMALRNRTGCVLRGEDPVICLLDSRMKQVFTELMDWKPSASDVIMQSGRCATQKPEWDAFQTAAKQAFCKRGLSFYAYDLARVSRLARKIADLAWKVYGDCLLDEMILDALASQQAVDCSE